MGGVFVGWRGSCDGRGVFFGGGRGLDFDEFDLKVNGVVVVNGDVGFVVGSIGFGFGMEVPIASV